MKEQQIRSGLFGGTSRANKSEEDEPSENLDVLNLLQRRRLEA